MARIFTAMRLITTLLIASVVLVACAESEPATTTTTEPVPPTTQAPSTTAPSTPTTEAVEPADAPSGIVEYAFAEGSEVRFLVGEELRGSPFTVVAVNSSVSGSFSVDTSGPTLVDGERVTITAADFVTDEERRDGAIDRFILDVSQHPEIIFDIESVSDDQVTGMLVIREIANEVVFDVVLEGDGDPYVLTGSAVVDRTEWDLNIPSVPWVANVDEDVTLEFEFILSPTS